MNKKDLDSLLVLYENVYSDEYLTEAPAATNVPYRVLRGLGGALRDLPAATMSQLQGQGANKGNDAALRRQAERGGRLNTLLRTGQVNKPTAPKPVSPSVQRQIDKNTKDRQTMNPQDYFGTRTEKPAAEKPAPPNVRPPAPKPAAAKPLTPKPTAAPKPFVKQTGDKAKDMATWAKANPTLANKPKTPNPLMQKTFGYQTGNAPDQIKAASVGGNPQKAQAAFARSKETVKKMTSTPNPANQNISSGYEWPSAKTIRDIAGAYASIYEAKKKDQDQDGDNDFADVRIARMIASGMSKAEAIAAVKNKEYNEEFESWVDSLVEEGYDLSDYTMDEMFDIYLDEAEGSYGATPKAYRAASKTKMTAKRKPFLKKMQSRTNPANRTSPYDSPRKGMTSDDRERARAGAAYGVGTRQDHDYPSEGPGGVTKSAKKLRKQKAMGEFGEAYEIDEATRMRKELGKEGETATRKELASRSKTYKRSGSVDKTIAAAERGADRPYIKYKRDESDSDRKKREERQSRTLRGLAASRRGSVRDKPRAGMSGYASKVEGGNKDLQSARQKAMSAGTLTPKEKKQFGEEYEVYGIVASYLLENNFATTINDANVIIENMSEVWIQDILEQSAIAARAAKVVNDQRQGYHGDTDAINKLQTGLSKSMGRLKKGQGPVVTPGMPVRGV